MLFHSKREFPCKGFNIERCDTRASHTMKNKKITAATDNMDPKEDTRFHEKKVSG